MATTVRIDGEVGDRLEKLSEATHRPKSYYATQALERFLDEAEEIMMKARDMETRYLSKSRPKRSPLKK